MLNVQSALVLFSLSLTHPAAALAQWVQTNGPHCSGVGVYSLAVNGTNLFAGTDGGVFRSTNNGTSWTTLDTGLWDPYVHSLAVSGTRLLVGTEHGMFLSTNNGENWTQINAELTKVYALVASGPNLFAGTFGDGVFLSTDNGANWTPVNAGLTNTRVASLTVSGQNLFAGTRGGGVWRRSIALSDDR